MRLPILRRLYILSFLFFTSFNDRVSIYILYPFPRQPIIYFFFVFFTALPLLRLGNPFLSDFDGPIPLPYTLINNG